jgi:hypothetical protein
MRTETTPSTNGLNDGEKLLLLLLLVGRACGVTHHKGMLTTSSSYCSVHYLLLLLRRLAIYRARLRLVNTFAIVYARDDSTKKCSLVEVVLDTVVHGRD